MKTATGPQSLEGLMAQAWAMEVEAAERYGELADAVETHNNREVAALFRKMQGYETAHARQILEGMGWKEAPPGALVAQSWSGPEAAETTPHQDVHYLMQPYHALQLALAAEERAERFFAQLVEAAPSEKVRRAARGLQAEEQEHVELVRKWMKKVVCPRQDWDHDPDPPRSTD